MALSRFTIVLVGVGLFFSAQACIEGPPQKAIEQRDHPTLVAFYKHQAEELREKAKRWDDLAESYERHGDPHGKLEPKQHAAHCRAIAQNSRKAAEEAEALASEHRAMMPHGMVQ